MSAKAAVGASALAELARLLYPSANRRIQPFSTAISSAGHGVERPLLDGAHERGRGLAHAPPPDGRGVGRQSGGAISKPAKSKPGATVQPTSVHAPRLVAVCQWPAGTTICGRWPARRSGPRWLAGASCPLGEIVSTSGAPAYQCQTSTASTRCHSETSPAPSR